MSFTPQECAALAASWRKRERDFARQITEATPEALRTQKLQQCQAEAVRQAEEWEKLAQEERKP